MKTLRQHITCLDQSMLSNLSWSDAGIPATAVFGISLTRSGYKKSMIAYGPKLKSLHLANKFSSHQ